MMTIMTMRTGYSSRRPPTLLRRVTHHSAMISENRAPVADIRLCQASNRQERESTYLQCFHRTFHQCYERLQIQCLRVRQNLKEVGELEFFDINCAVVARNVDDLTSICRSVGSLTKPAKSGVLLLIILAEASRKSKS